MSSRQQQRKLEKEMLKRGQALLKTGLPVQPAREAVVAVAMLLQRTLADSTDATRASRAAGQMHALNAASERQHPGTAKLACAKGCSYCCHTIVMATAPEVLHLAGAIRADAARAPLMLKDVLERCRRTAGLTPEQRFGTKLPCPLLLNNACSRYRERPGVCRQTTSFKLDDCVDEFNGKGFGGQIQVSNVFLAHTRNSRLPLLAALRATLLSDETYELSEALARALATEQAEARWLAGEDIFSGVQRAEHAPQLSALAVQLVSDLARLAVPAPAVARTR